MPEKQINRIIEKYTQNSFPEHIQLRFRKWLLASSKEDEKEDALLQSWNAIQANADESTIFDLLQLHKKIALGGKSEKTKKSFKHSLLRIAAIFILPSICTILTYWVMQKYSTQQIEFIECFVGNGEQKSIMLPDGTTVDINSGSLLVYPKRFNGQNRTVFLDGEANFSVSKDENRPFVVKTSHLEVQALGTVFNIQSYRDLPQITASLEEGKIKVDTRVKKSQSFILLPDEQIIYNHRTNEVEKKKVDAKRQRMWKDGYLVFQGASIEEILYTLERRFDVTMQFDASKFDKQSITVRFMPDDSLDESLAIIKGLIKTFEYKIKDKIIYIQ